MTEITPNDNKEDVIDGFQYQFILNDDLEDFLTVLATAFHRIDVYVDEIYEQRFVDTATGADLEKLGAKVGVEPRTNENKDTYRYRVQLRYAIAASEGTGESFENILRVAFGDDVDRIGIDTPTDEPVVTLHIPQTMIDGIPITRIELESELDQAVPTSDAVQIITDDVFLLGDDGANLSEGGMVGSS